MHVLFSQTQSMWFKYKKTFASFAFLALLCNVTTAIASEIEWKVFVKPYADSNPVLAKKTRVGEEFVIRESDLENVPSSSRDIVNALDGISFLIRQLPTEKPVAIHIILNVSGNTFERIRGIPLFLNISFEAFVAGEKHDDLQFDRSPMLLTIPKTGLNMLLSLCDVDHTVGGVGKDMGIEAKVKYDTWSKIKLLFR